MKPEPSAFLFLPFEGRADCFAKPSVVKVWVYITGEICEFFNEVWRNIGEFLTGCYELLGFRELGILPCWWFAVN